MDIKKSLGASVRKFRLAANLNQDEFPGDQSSLSRFERGESGVSIERFFEISLWVGAPASQIWADAEGAESKPSQPARFDPEIVRGAAKQVAKSKEDMAAIQHFLMAYEHVAKVRIEGRKEATPSKNRKKTETPNVIDTAGNSGAVTTTGRKSAR